MADDFDMLAAEYVLGTLDAGDRRTCEQRIARDKAFAAAVEGWQHKLAPLDVAFEQAEPSPALWKSIEMALPAAALPRTDRPLSVTVADQLARALARWRAAALGMTALAAGLGGLVAVREWNVAKVTPAADYVAVVNRGGDQPALIIRVDMASRTVFVRPVVAATPENRSLELWVIKGSGQPQSMGVIGADSQKLVLPDNVAASSEPTVFAVTVEQPGGSPTGGPTTAPIYSGALIKQ